ncbi:hypothetical protein B0T13DRAFT_477819 [Neurospora crassa]|nr:hypothetical protein B0T13DRAFT_477819 [Neurospora crassa]
MCSYIRSQFRYCRKWWEPGSLAVIMPWAFISLEGRATPLRRSQRASDRLSSWGNAERSNGAERGETCGCSAEVAPIPASLLNCTVTNTATLTELQWSFDVQRPSRYGHHGLEMVRRTLYGIGCNASAWKDEAFDICS